MATVAGGGVVGGAVATVVSLACAATGTVGAVAGVGDVGATMGVSCAVGCPFVEASTGGSGVGFGVGAACAVSRYADVNPSVALRAKPVDKMRADRAGCRSRRMRSIVIVFTRLVTIMVIVVFVGIMIVVFATGGAAKRRFVHDRGDDS